MTIGLANLLLALAILSEIVGTSALKASYGMTRLWPSALVILGYGSAFLLLSHTLKTMPVGLVYAVWSGAGVVGVAIVGVLVYGEAMPLSKVVGMALIVGGVALVQLQPGGAG